MVHPGRAEHMSDASDGGFQDAQTVKQKRLVQPTRVYHFRAARRRCDSRHSRDHDWAGYVPHRAS